MTEKNTLEEELLTKIAGGTDTPLVEATYILQKCKMLADMFCIPVKEEQYEDVYKLHKNVSLAYTTEDAAERKTYIHRALGYADRVINIYSSDKVLSDIKDLLLQAQEAA